MPHDLTPLMSSPPAPRAPRRRGPLRAAGKARTEQVLDAADRLILASGAAALSLPAVAAEAGVPASSLYHFFPTVDALLAALLERYNALQDKMLDDAIASAQPIQRWTDLVDVLLLGARRFYDAFPVYGRLMAQAGATPLLGAVDLAHMDAMGARFADTISAAFVLPDTPDLSRRLTLAVLVIDRLWSVLPLDDGIISNFAFEESRRMVLSYLANILPPAPPLREPAA